MTEPHDIPDGSERPVFAHKSWMIGMVLIFAVIAILAGLVNPVWFIIGSPCILVLIVYIWVRLYARYRSDDSDRQQ